MINYSQVQRLSAKYGLPEEIIEKDYLIEFILFYLAKDEFFKEKFVFRGGTALKKAYFPDYRFSEDLDFLVNDKENLAEYEQRITRILEAINLSYPFHLGKRLELSRDRLGLFILYDIFTEVKAIKELKVDILRDSHIPSYHTADILFSYQEFQNQNLSLKIYKLESMASDKISRILDVDNEPRDIYDLWYLLQAELDILILKEALKKRHGYDIYLPNLLTELDRDVYSRNWRIRLEKQIPKLPHYKTIAEELKELIKTKLLH